MGIYKKNEILKDNFKLVTNHLIELRKKLVELQEVNILLKRDLTNSTIQINDLLEYRKQDKETIKKLKETIKNVKGEEKHGKF